jgi:LysM repeat protein
MGAYRQSSLRALAPAAIVVFAIVFLVIVIASLGGGDSSSSEVERVQTSKPRKQARKKPQKAVQRTPSGAKFYTVRSGDNLSTIAAKTGVPVDKLLELNPSLDPQGLVNGQRVKLPGATLKTGATGATGATGTTGPG